MSEEDSLQWEMRGIWMINEDPTFLSPAEANEQFFFGHPQQCQVFTKAVPLDHWQKIRRDKWIVLGMRWLASLRCSGILRQDEAILRAAFALVRSTTYHNKHDTQRLGGADTMGIVLAGQELLTDKVEPRHHVKCAWKAEERELAAIRTKRAAKELRKKNKQWYILTANRGR